MIECSNPNCDGKVTETTARVFGDNDNQMHGCPECIGWTKVKKGVSAGVERTTFA